VSEFNGCPFHSCWEDFLPLLTCSVLGHLTSCVFPVTQAKINTIKPQLSKLHCVFTEGYFLSNCVFLFRQTVVPILTQFLFVDNI